MLNGAVIDASMRYTFDHCGCIIMFTMKYVILQKKDHTKLKAYCRHMEQLDDEMLLPTIMQHSAAWRHAMSFPQNPFWNTGAMLYTMSFLCFRCLMSRHVQSLLSLC